jgi:V/A-type H+-transporting ATPase subunit I
MTWREQLLPAPMRRAAIVAPDDRFRRVLVEVADAGVFEPDSTSERSSHPTAATDRDVPTEASVVPRLSPTPIPDDTTADAGLVAGESQLDQRTRATTHLDGCAVLAGWVPDRHLDALRAVLAPHGGAVADIPVRRGLTAPTAHSEAAVGEALRPLVTTYAEIPYRNIDPTLFAALAYVVMFGMMFGDVAHGFAIVVLGVLAQRGHGERLRSIHRAAPFLIGAGAAAIGFGFLYGEAFGPTGLVPTLWLRPLDEPEKLLGAGLILGGCLLAITFVIASVNRWREAGFAAALYDATGIAGAMLFAGGAVFVIGVAISNSWVSQVGAVVGGIGAVLTFVGLVVKAGPGGSGIAEAIVEMFDTVLRLGSNVVSFTRLAAFGLTHAVITGVVWEGTVSLWEGGAAPGIVAAGILFVVGNVVAFSLGALVGAVQALRLEYYEMFSRLFAAEGRAFEPLHIPVERLEVT